MSVKNESPNQPPVLIYDGDCGFCKRWILFFERATKEAIKYIPYQNIFDSTSQKINNNSQSYPPQLSKEHCQTSVQLVWTDNKIYSAAQAVCLVLTKVKGLSWLNKLYNHSDIVRNTMEWGYKKVAKNRTFFGSLSILLFGKEKAPSMFYASSSLLVRGLGIIYFFAFYALLIQVKGLFGEEGIQPFSQVIHKLQAAEISWYKVPTLFSLGVTDAVLVGACSLGIILSLSIIAGWFPSICLALNGILYLSFVSIGQPFLSFQWDVLLLESGFLGACLYPFFTRHIDSGSTKPSFLIHLCIRILLFKLMLGSGLVKLMSGDSAWHNLTALKYHFFTQPLPHKLAWFMHQLPDSLLRGGAGIMFVIELVVPFMILGTRRIRKWAFFPLIGLQIMILMTGNYGFFNFLTMVLCLTLLEDHSLRFIRNPLISSVTSGNSLLSKVRVALVVGVSICVVSSGFVLEWSRFVSPISPSNLWVKMAKMLRPFCVVNTYGLFAVMTKQRHDIAIEGSMDGQYWEPYVFKYKPEDLGQAPRWIQPYQPRLDWQMWFAALGSYKQNQWYLSLLEGLLYGKKPIQNLFEKVPFQGTPPIYIRSTVYDYTFTTPQEHYSTAQWWKKKALGLYAPTVKISNK